MRSALVYHWLWHSPAMRAIARKVTWLDCWLWNRMWSRR